MLMVAASVVRFLASATNGSPIMPTTEMHITPPPIEWRGCFVQMRWVSFYWGGLFEEAVDAIDCHAENSADSDNGCSSDRHRSAENSHAD